MTEGFSESSLPLPVRKPELQQDAARARFVTGNHATTEHDITVNANKLYGGDLTAHQWDSKVPKELKTLSPQPTVLAIDGMAPEHPGQQGVRDYDAGQKLVLWQLMPGAPSEINSSGDVFYVAGDVARGSYGNALEPLFTQNASSSDAQNKAIQTLKESYPDLFATSSLVLPDFYKVLPSSLAVFAALKAAVELGDKQYTKAHPEVSEAKKFGRRSVLQLGAGLGILATGFALAKYGPWINVPKPSGDNFLDTVMRIVKRENADQKSIDGRTALMIEKGIVAAESLGQKDVTVVAGDAHEHNKDNLLANPQARADAVVAYAKILLKIVDQASNEAGFNADLKLTAKGMLLDNLLYGQILKAKDTGLTHVPATEVNQVLDRTIAFQSDFMLGGSVVSDAVDNLRQGAPKAFGPFGRSIHE